ncbi:MAG: TniB family NTP-binding protein [Magnetococcales bacterium]|nr:TniB family NTP-binding protein [Magnetococcales bacterium]
MPQDTRNSPIVLLDIVGFDRLQGATQKREILRRFQDLITQCATPFVGFADPWKAIPRHGTGDGYYFTMDAFPSPVALRFALDLKKSLIQDNPKHPDFPLYLRVALTLGDVETVEDQLLSDAFTEAARLIDQPRLRNLVRPPDEPMALVVSATFMENWSNHPKRDDKKLRPLGELPWIREEFLDKHGKVWTGYLQTREEAVITVTSAPIQKKQVTLLIGHSLEDPLPEAVEMATATIRAWLKSKLDVELRVDQATKASLNLTANQGVDILVFYGHGDETGLLQFADGPIGAQAFRDIVGGLELFTLFACHGATFAKDLDFPWIAFSAPILRDVPQGFMGEWVKRLDQMGAKSAMDAAMEQCRPHMDSKFLDVLRYADDLPDTPLPTGIPHLVWGPPHLFGRSCTDLLTTCLGRVGYSMDHDPFVGRLDLLKTLLKLPDPRNDHDRRRVVWIHGDAGMGKTALVRQFTTWVSEMAFHAKDDPITLMQMNCWEYSDTASLEKELMQRLAACYQLNLVSPSWDSLFGALENKPGRHVWVLDDLTYLADGSSVEKNDSIIARMLGSDAGKRMVEILIQGAKRAALTLQLVVTARRPGPNHWKNYQVSFLEAAEARELANRVLQARWPREKGRPPKTSLEGADWIFRIVGFSTALFKRALFLAADRGEGFLEYSQRMPQGMAAQEINDLAQQLAAFEAQQLQELAPRYHFDFGKFLKFCYALVHRVGHFTAAELKDWFNSSLTQGDSSGNVQETYTEALEYLKTIGFLAMKPDSDGNRWAYVIPPNQRLALNALTDATIQLPEGLHWRGAKERMALVLEWWSSTRPDRVQMAQAECLGIENDFRSALNEAEPAAAVFRAMNIRSELFGENKNILEDRIAIYEQIVSLYDQHRLSYGQDDETVAVHVSSALANKGVIRGMLGQLTEAIAVFDDVIRCFGKRPEPGIAEQVAKALVNKGAALGVLGQLIEAIAVCDEVIQRFGERTEPSIAEHVAKALTNKGVALGKLDKRAEAIAVYDEVIWCFGKRPEPEIAEQVRKAIELKKILEE